MKAGGRAIYLHPGWEQHSKHSVEKKGGGSPWGSRPSHSAQRRDWSQSPFCSERRRSAPDAMLALEHGSPGEQNKAWQAGAQLGALGSTGGTTLEGALPTVFHVNDSPWSYTTLRPRPRFYPCGLLSVLYG